MTSSISSYYTGQRTGVSGLVTGLDTDSIVESMTYYTRNKIDDVLKDTEALNWEMDAIQNISKQLNDFAVKYTSYSSSTNLFSNSFFNANEVTSTGLNSKYVTATGHSSMLESLAITGIKQVATAASFHSNANALSSNKITTGSLDFSAEGKEINNFAGMSMSVSYGNNTYTVKFAEDFNPTSAEDVAAEFNRAAAEIEVSGGTTLADEIKLGVSGDKLEFSRVDPNDSATFKISGASDAKALAAMGFKVGSQMTSADSLSGEIAVDVANFTTELNFNDTLKGNTVTFNLNGLSKNIVFEDSINFSNINEFQTYMQDKLNSTFGEGRVQAVVEGDAISYQVMKTDASGNKVVDTSSKLTISSTNTNIVSEKGIFGIASGTTNKVDISSDIGDNSLFTLVDGKGSFTVNDVTIEYTAEDSIDDIIDRVNASEAGVTMTYMETSNSFSVVADDKGAQGRIEFEDVSGNLTEALFGADMASKVTAGQDSIITIQYDGMEEQEIIRSSDSFDIDGVTVKLAANAAENFDPTEAVRFDSEPKTEQIVDAITAMAEEYNKIVDLVNSAVNTKPETGYEPLTEAQKAEMSEKEIELWEEKAKQGILFADSDLRNLASELRFMFSFPVDGGTSLEDLGISMSSSYSDNGKITIDTQKLTEALESDLEGVKAAFTTTTLNAGSAEYNEVGFMQRLDNIVDKYTSTLGYDKGILIERAGEQGSVSEKDSYIQKQIEELQKQYETLLDRLASEEDRYYAQFTALEVYTQEMNAQSSWLSSFGTSM